MGKSMLDELASVVGRSLVSLERPHAAPAWCGQVVALHMCPCAFLPMRGFETLTLVAGHGIQGDRKRLLLAQVGRGPSGHPVEVETLEALWRDHGVALSPAEHRRNVTIRGVPLNHLVGRCFRLGATLLEATRLNARILVGGMVRVGDAVGPA